MSLSRLYKGCSQVILLKLLEENKRVYGYEITQKVKVLTADSLTITEGALYPLLHKLEAEGLLTVETENIGNRIRKYYSLTNQGRKEQVKSPTVLQQFLQTIQLVINPKPA